MNLSEILLMSIAVGVWAVVLVLSYGLFFVGPKDNEGEF